MLIELCGQDDPMVRSKRALLSGPIQRGSRHGRDTAGMQKGPESAPLGHCCVSESGHPRGGTSDRRGGQDGECFCRPDGGADLQTMRTPEAKQVLQEITPMIQRSANRVPPPMPRSKEYAIINGWGRQVDPDEDCTFTVDNGSLLIGVPGTPHDLSAELNRMNAPRVLQEVTGDFAIEVRVSGEFSPGEANIAGRTSYNGAGLLVMQDERTYIRLERAVLVRDGATQHYVNFEVRVNGQNVRFGTPADYKVDDSGDCYLRLERKGEQVAGAVRQGDDNWHLLAPKEVRLHPQLSIGVAAVNASSKPFTPSVVELRVSQPVEGTSGEHASRLVPSLRSMPPRPNSTRANGPNTWTFQ